MTHFLSLFKLTLIASEWCAGEAGTDVYNADMQLASFHKTLGGEKREGFNSGRNFTHKATNVILCHRCGGILMEWHFLHFKNDTFRQSKAKKLS